MNSAKKPGIWSPCHSLPQQCSMQSSVSSRKGVLIPQETLLTGRVKSHRAHPTHRHVRPAPCIPRFGNGVHELSANAKVTEFNISISVQKNIGRFDVCRGKKFKPVSHSWRFQFQAEQLQRIEAGSAAPSLSPLVLDAAQDHEGMEAAPEMPHAQRQMPNHPEITLTWKKHRLKGQQNRHWDTCSKPVLRLVAVQLLCLNFE